MFALSDGYVPGYTIIVSPMFADAVAESIVLNGSCKSPTIAVSLFPLGETNTDCVRFVPVFIPVNCEPSPTNDPVYDEAVMSPETLRLLRAASEPDVITFFQFGILFEFSIVVSYIYMPYISLLPFQVSDLSQ